jgi:citrate lyase subunit beta / citryl-CoA lyase
MLASTALFQDQIEPRYLPACDHYAGSEKLMLKSMAIQHEKRGAFDVTFDCEDGASVGNEAQHASMIAQLIASEKNEFGRIGVRIHEPHSPFFQLDLATIFQTTTCQPAYLVIPKITGAQQLNVAIQIVNEKLLAAKRADKNDAPTIPIHVLIETHGALAEVHAIASHPQVDCLSFGIMDFVSSHSGAIPAAAMQSPEQFSHPLVVRAKLEIAAACHRYGKVASHNVSTDISHPETAGNDANRAKSEFGYTRMWSIHPSQIAPILNAMLPNEEELNTAIEILDTAYGNQWGPSKINGTLHDRASYRYYWSIIKKAQINRIELPKKAYNFI